MGIFDLVNRYREPRWEAWPVNAAAETHLSARDELGMLVADICRDRGLHEAKIGVVMYLLAADPADEEALVSAAPDDLALAEIVAAFALEDPSTRSLAAAAAFDAALRLHQSARARQLPVGPDAVWLRQAKAAIDCALHRDRGAIEYHVLAAQTLAMQRRHAEALEHARIAIEGDRQDPAFLELAGTCALEAGRLQEAESLFARAQKLAPDSESAREGMTAARRAARLMAEIENEAALWPQPSTIIPKIKQAYEGDRDAMALLARAYYDGSSVAPNPAMAYMWFSLLARFGDSTARDRLRTDPLLWGNKNEGTERVERWMRARRDH